MELRFEVNKPAYFVFNYLTDMQKFCSIHPVIHKIEDEGNNSYMIHETLKFGFIPITFTYPATVESNKEEYQIKMKATIMKFTKVEMQYKITDHGNTSIVNEIINYHSILPLKFAMRRIFKKQHEILFKNMNELS